MILKNKFLLILFALLFSTALKAQDSIACRLWVDSVMKTMTVDERIGQLFVYNTPASTDKWTANRLMKIVEERKIGGLLFWNGSLAAQAELTNEAQKISKVPLFVTMDGEWGLAMRLKNALRYPKKMTLSALEDEQLIYDLGAELGRQCNEMRIQINFDPVLDVNLNPENPVINTRSFGEDPADVARKAKIFIKGLHSKNVMAVGKHFPGHGDTMQDSHQELAIVTHDLAQLDSVDLVPYQLLKDSFLDGVMIGHIRVYALDSTGSPASLSPIVVNGLLKTDMDYKGLVFTDAMKMKAVSDIEDASVQALLAGVDVILDPASVNKEFDKVKAAVVDSVVSMSLIDEKCRKILSYKYRAGLGNYQPIDTAGLEQRINTPEAKRLQQELSRRSVTVFKNDNNLLPIRDLKDKKIALVSVGSDNYHRFKESISLYDSVSFYSITDTTSEEEIAVLDSLLLEKDMVIFSIHNTNVPDSVLYPLCKDKESVVQLYFISPYQMGAYEMSVTRAEACILGYENLTQSHMAVAQALFGGLNTIGRMPIKVRDFCPKDKCFMLSKIRLGYGLPEEVGMNSMVLNGIDSIANDAIAKGAAPGCQILVARKGMVVYQKSFGYHDYTNVRAVNNTDIYDLASMTKTSATLPVLMKLYDKHKIKLDQKLSHYLSDLRWTNKKDITIKELLYHESGLPAYLPFYKAAIEAKSVAANVMQEKNTEGDSVQIDKHYYAHKNSHFKFDFMTTHADEEHQLQVADSMYLLNNFKDLVWAAMKKVGVKSDKKYVYSDLSFMFLQHLVEKETEQPLDESVQNEFYKDLGATSLGFLPLKRFPKDRVVPTELDNYLRNQLLQGYVHDQNAAFLGGVSGHAGLFGNANDLAKLYQMYLNGGEYGGKRYLSKETCELFTTQKSDSSRRLLGFDRHVVEDVTVGDNTAHVMYGHTGFTGTCVWVDPENELIYIFLSNRLNPDGGNRKLIKMNVRTNIEDVIYKSIVK